MAASPELKGCETCKERKIRCDKKVPVCGNCGRSHRACIAALKLRLSWPRTKDRCRFVVGPMPVVARENGAGTDKAHFLNVTFRQVEQYLALSEDGHSAIDLSAQNDIQPSRIILRNPPVLRNRLGNLKEGSRTLSYFYSVVSDHLPSILGEKYGFRDVLMRMALRDDGPSSQAVLFSVLSLATLHQQQDWNGDAVTFKARSIRALAESANRGANLTLETILQHMAAAIVLCRIEISLSIDASTLWCLFVCGVNTLQEARQNRIASSVLASEDSRLLYSHVHYHTTLSEFGLRHWIRPGSLAEAQKIEFKGTEIGFKCRRKPTMIELLSHISEEWQLLDAILSLRSTHDSSYSNSKAHLSALDELEQRIASAYSRLTVDLHSTSHSNRTPGPNNIIAIVQKRCIIAACWIYLLRTERRLQGPSEIITSLLRDAFDDGAASLKHVVECNLPWPVFIIGAEASSEAQRRLLLDLIRRPGDVMGDGKTAEGGYGQYRTAGYLLRDAWAMEDLHAVKNEGGRYLDYERKLHSLFTASQVLPALA